MSTPLDTRINPKVLKAITKWGRLLVLRTFPTVSINKVAGTVNQGPAADFSVKGFGPLEYDQALVNGTTVQAGDCYAIILPVDITGTSLVPKIVTGLGVLVDSKVWKVVTFTPYKPGDDVAAFELQLRS